MTQRFLPARAGIAVVASAILIAAFGGPVLATNIVVQEITGSGLTASLSDLVLTDVAYQNAAHPVTGTMVLTAEDNTGTGAGWNVTVLASDLVWVGSANGGANIPAAALALTAAAAPVLVSGQLIGVAAATGPQVPPTSPLGSLDTPRKVLSATAAYGAGTYTQALGMTLTIPAMSRVGTYTGTLTTTITAAP